MKRSNIFIGEVISKIMSERKITKAELARRLEVRPQSIDYLLSRKSIDTDTLYNVSIALDFDFAVLYSIKGHQTNLDNNNETKCNIKKAKVIVELELEEEDIRNLNLKKRITNALS